VYVVFSSYSSLFSFKLSLPPFTKTVFILVKKIKTENGKKGEIENPN
jgi:hypothetical protein